MRKAKGKIELRYYDVPQDEFLVALYGESWKRRYGAQGSRMHFHNLLEIGICHTGNGNMLLDEERISYTGGMISVIPANYPHDTISDKDTECFWEYLFIDTERVLTFLYPDDLLRRQKILNQMNRKAFLGKEVDMPALSGIVHTILDEMKQKPGMYRECVRALAVSVVVMIARLSSDGMIPEGIRQKNGFDQVRPALEYIRENYQMSMKIAEMAEVCHMSESHFRRLFEKNINMTPVEYLNQIRVRKACDLIKKTNCSMEEIAVKVGFTTTSTFNRNFKRITGTSPYQWKKQPENYESRLARFNIMVEKSCVL